MKQTFHTPECTLYGDINRGSYGQQCTGDTRESNDDASSQRNRTGIFGTPSLARESRLRVKGLGLRARMSFCPSSPALPRHFAPYCLVLPQGCRIRGATRHAFRSRHRQGG